MLTRVFLIDCIMFVYLVCFLMCIVTQISFPYECLFFRTDDIFVDKIFHGWCLYIYYCYHLFFCHICLYLIDANVTSSDAGQV